jgi:quercetin dioxygenase-like cupin family protein
MPETVIRAAEAPHFQADELIKITGYASPSRGSQSVSAWKIRLEPGAASPIHQLTHGEAFIAMAGRGRFEFDERVHELGPGDAICVPADTLFRLANDSDERFEAICCMTAEGKGQVGDGEPFTPPWAE